MRYLLPGRVDVGDAGPHFVLPTRAALGLGALAFLVLMTEGAVLDWSAAWLRGDLGASPSVAATAFAAFSAAMAVGRFSGDWLRRRWGATVLVRASAGMAAAGLALALLLATPLAAVIGFAAAGPGPFQHSAGPVRCRRPAAGAAARGCHRRHRQRRLCGLPGRPAADRLCRPGDYAWARR